MSQQKELAYGTAISITAERALKHYFEITKMKEEKKFFFALYLDITPEEFRAGKFERTFNKQKKEYYVENVGHSAIESISGCDVILREPFQDKMHEYRVAMIKKHEIEEIEDLKLDLEELYDRCLGNDFKIDQDELRKNLSIFFNFIDLFKIKKSVDISGRIDEAIKQISNKPDMPIIDKTGGKNNESP